MNTPTLSRAARWSLAVFALSVSSNSVVHAQVSMDASDLGGETSFNTGLHWSDDLAPSAGKDYVVDQKTLRTPSGTHTFQGDSLNVGNGSYGFIRLDQSSSDITIDDLILQNGEIYVGAFGTFTLNGNMNLLGNGRLENDHSTGKTFVVTSTISGGSVLTLAGGGSSGGVIRLNSTNSFSGGTRVVDSGFAVGNAMDAFGTGNVTVANNSTLTLNVTQALSSTASLILDANSMVNLDFTDGNTIVSGISLDGGSSFLTDSGTYGAIGSGATYEYAQFAGDGFIAIPETSMSVLLIGGLSILFVLRRNRHR
ncbi:hypothetical protein [Puniceicoccus vermicola]|uniref:PEP-CTERM sorting domain-containing protein n=1 Tax=Puniceicoccus vermicola TaxID=388746 RepID=A0A7X1AVW0_9BACT|nr:hypothetical protein [Puniceicoccus vermicola]MBC2600797.1 hypothetical protein [Puniceicoccus vermicola]